MKKQLLAIALIAAILPLAPGCQTPGSSKIVMKDCEDCRIIIRGNRNASDKTFPFDVLRSPTVAAGGSGSSVSAEGSESSPLSEARTDSTGQE